MLLEKGHVPHPDEDGGATDQFWSHMCERTKFSWPQEVVATMNEGKVLPLYLWGDDAQINERCEKLIACACGNWLDERSNGKDSMYPLFCIRSESWIKSHSLVLDPIFL